MRAKPTFSQVPNSVRQGAPPCWIRSQNPFTVAQNAIWLCATHKHSPTSSKKSQGPRGLTCQGSQRARLALAGRPRVVEGGKQGHSEEGARGGRWVRRATSGWAPGNGTREAAGRGLRGGREGKPRGSEPAQGATLDPDPGPRPQPRSETGTHDPASEQNRGTPPRPHRSQLERACPPPRRGLGIRAAAARRLWGRGRGSVGGRPGSGVGRDRGYGPSDPHRPGPTSGRLRNAGAVVAGQPLPVSTHNGQGRPRHRDPGPRPR